MTFQITIFYAVVGTAYHRHLERSLRSLAERIKCPYKVKILSPDYKSDKYEIISKIDHSGHLHAKHENWRMRYLMGPNIDTEYALYVDADTVFVNDNLEVLAKQVGIGFGACRHFWVPTIGHYLRQAMNPKYHIEVSSLYQDSKYIFKPFYASGAFLFHNNIANLQFLEDVLEMQTTLAPAAFPYREGFTDELWLANAAALRKKKIIELNGAFNHCAEPPMPLELRSNVLYGKNPQDENFEKVTLLHCDCSRRDPGHQYSPDVYNKCREMFYL